MEATGKIGGSAFAKTHLPLFFIGLLSGVFMASFFDLPVFFFTAALIFVPALLRKSALAVVLPLAFLALGSLVGFFRFGQELDVLQQMRGSEFQGQVVVHNDPADKESYQRAVIRPVGKKSKESGHFMAYLPKYPKLKKGDILDIHCTLEIPENRNGGFDYVRYLAKDGIYRICASPKFSLGEAGGEGIFSLGAKVKNSFERQIAGEIPEPESSYLAGLLVGGSDRLPEEVATAFRLTGTTHTVAVSGYNITIIASAISAFLVFCGFWRKQAFWFAVAGIILFVYLIGAPASAVRAAIMGILVLWAAKNGRLANSGRALLLTGALMVFSSPLILVYDIGFQLSFLATIGIVYVYGPLSERFGVRNDFLELKSILLITISAQLGVLGILIYNFQSFSPISLLANLLILPAIPFIMLGGSIVIMASYVAPPLAQLLGVAVWFALHLEIKVVKLLSAIPWASIPIENVGAYWLGGYYLFFALLAYQLNGKRYESGSKSANL